MENLPSELLMEIFSYLKFKDLCVLTQTCSTFNEIIINKTSLIDEFRLVINQQRHEEINFIGSRMYKSVVIHYTDENVFEYLEEFGKNIKNLALRSEVMNYQNFRRIFTLCPNVKKLSIASIHLEHTADDLKEPLMKLELDALSIKSYQSFLMFFMDCSMKKLRLRGNERNDITKIFLKKQKTLEELKFDNICEYPHLFRDNTLHNVDFKLKRLIMTFHDVSDVNIENLKTFIENQKELNEISILRHDRSLHLDDIPLSNLMNSLGKLSNIKKFHFSGVYFDFNPMPFIESLIMENPNHRIPRSFSEKFPNLKSLSIDKFIFVKFIENSDENEPIKRSSCDFHIPNVKTLTIKNSAFKHSHPFAYNNVRIENLIIDSLVITQFDWLIEWLNKSEIKLNSLTLINLRIKKSQQMYIESLTRGENMKIKKLKIIKNVKFDDKFIYDDCEDN